MGRGRRRCLGLQEGDRLIGPLALFPRLACGQSYKGSLGSALPQPPPAGVPQVGPGSPSPLMKESVWVNKSHHRFVLLSSPSPTNIRLDTPWPGFSGSGVERCRLPDGDAPRGWEVESALIRPGAPLDVVPRTSHSDENSWMPTLTTSFYQEALEFQDCLGHLWSSEQGKRLLTQQPCN